MVTIPSDGWSNQLQNLAYLRDPILDKIITSPAKCNFSIALKQRQKIPCDDGLTS